MLIQNLVSLLPPMKIQSLPSISQYPLWYKIGGLGKD